MIFYVLLRTYTLQSYWKLQYIYPRKQIGGQRMTVCTINDNIATTYAGLQANTLLNIDYGYQTSTEHASCLQLSRKSSISYSNHPYRLHHQHLLVHHRHHYYCFHRYCFHRYRCPRCPHLCYHLRMNHRLLLCHHLYFFHHLYFYHHLYLCHHLYLYHHLYHCPHLYYHLRLNYHYHRCCYYHHYHQSRHHHRYRLHYYCCRYHRHPWFPAVVQHLSGFLHLLLLSNIDDKIILQNLIMQSISRSL